MENLQALKRKDVVREVGTIPEQDRVEVQLDYRRPVCFHTCECWGTEEKRLTIHDCWVGDLPRAHVEKHLEKARRNDLEQPLRCWVVFGCGQSQGDDKWCDMGMEIEKPVERVELGLVSEANRVEEMIATAGQEVATR